MSNESPGIQQLPGEGMDATANTLTIVRIFNAPRELLFAAWTDPDQLARWWGPAGLRSPRERISIDAQVGGVWSAPMVMDDGSAEFPATGTFTRMDPPNALEMREGPTAMFPFASSITVSFDDVGGATKMTIVQHFDTESFDFGDSKDGWGTSLEKLRALAGGHDGGHDGGAAAAPARS